MGGLAGGSSSEEQYVTSPRFDAPFFKIQQIYIVYWRYFLPMGSDGISCTGMHLARYPHLPFCGFIYDQLSHLLSGTISIFLDFLNNVLVL